ncbi:MAG: 2-dehydro-3-deoxygalactonokinase, partial [Ginsengibacter sp.]
MGNDLFISVDWGTSNFRLRLVEKLSQNVIQESISPMGVKQLYSKWQEQGGDREWIFLNFLKQQIDGLQINVSKNIEVVISGMASSSIGIRELPYAPLPFDTSGKGLCVEVIKHPLFPGSIQLISGVCSDSDVMRGEETQIVGLAEEGFLYDKIIFILPGTHSKHVICENDRITGFNTYMTGELFQVIRQYSILKNSVAKPPGGDIDLIDFDAGVLMSESAPSILNSLFKVRTNDILGKKSAEENYYFLSGLLIGAEMVTLRSMSFDQVLLCAGNDLHELYERA